jgi:Delta7-sterol 5-desaturase
MITQIINFFGVNTFIFILSIINYVVNACDNIIVRFFTILLQNLILLFFICFFTKAKQRIKPNASLPKEKYYGEFAYNLVTATCVEVATVEVVRKLNMISIVDNINVWTYPIYFISMSFMFEIIFDFFHYWTHRIVHIYPKLYKNIHKHHHTHQHVTPIIAFYQSPLDLIITNSIPTLLTLMICPSMSHFTFILLFNYKKYIEIAGHNNKQLAATSFPQFMWLPRLLHIELSVYDHYGHHTNFNCNYAKRFSLWDKIFGTYVKTTETKQCI